MRSCADRGSPARACGALALACAAFAAACGSREPAPAPAPPAAHAPPPSTTGVVQRVKGFRLPQVDEENRIKSQLTGDEAEMYTNDDVHILGARAEMYQDGKVQTTVTASEAYYHRGKDLLTSDSDIRIENRGTVITGIGWWWDRARDKAQIQSAVRVEIMNSKGWFLQEGTNNAR